VKPNSIHCSPYKNWKIIVFPSSLKQQEYFFSCEPPDSEESLSDDKLHDTPDSAIAAAEAFIERRIAGDGLGSFLDKMLEQGLISKDTYTQALRWIARITQL